MPSSPGQNHAGADDASAWVAAAVEQYEAPLIQYCMRLLRGDIDRARDVVQDAFLKLWTADRSAIEGHLGQWLYRVCRNRSLDVRKKEQRMTSVQDEQLDVIGRIPASDRPFDAQHPDSAMAEPTAPKVIAMLESLSEAQQEALRLKFQGGLSYKEIAAVMDITANHVGVIIHLAIKTLRERAAATSMFRGDA